MGRQQLFLGLAMTCLAAAACSATGGGGPGLGGSSGASASTGGTAVGGTGGAGVAGAAGTGGGIGGSINVTGGTGGGTTTGGAPGTGGASAGGAGGGSGNCGKPPPTDQAIAEKCDDGLDQNLNGFEDEGCPCNLGQTQPCFKGYPSEATQTECHMGTQTCGGTNEFRSWGPCEGSGCGTVPPPEEICDDNVDNDCDGLIDEGCALNVEVNADGECFTVACPQQAPFLIGCKNMLFEGNDAVGCVSTITDGSGRVYLQEGDKCCNPALGGDCGHVSGTLICSSKPSPAGLNATNCPMNRTNPTYRTAGNCSATATPFPSLFGEGPGCGC